MVAWRARRTPYKFVPDPNGGESKRSVVKLGEESALQLVKDPCRLHLVYLVGVDEVSFVHENANVAQAYYVPGLKKWN